MYYGTLEMVFIPTWDAIDKIWNSLEDWHCSSLSPQSIFMQRTFLFDFWLFRDMLSLCQLNCVHLKLLVPCLSLSSVRITSVCYHVWFYQTFK